MYSANTPTAYTAKLVINLPNLKENTINKTIQQIRIKDPTRIEAPYSAINQAETHPIPYLVVGKTRNRPLQIIPTIKGKLCITSSTSLECPGNTHPVTR